jgi:endothelin-converting enzyme/putative endopeptidase
MTRRLLSFLGLALFPAFLAAQSATPHGVEVGDIDRSAQPCNDFFQFANGAWRAANPIPASMPRWSRRWQAGENAKDRLKEILDGLPKDNPAGSTEQLLADYYGSCMDQPHLDALGAKPLAPWLAKIDGAKDLNALEGVMAELHDVQVGVPFSLTAQQDLHDPTSVLADFAATGYAMPDRDYYLKNEPRFVEARAKYVAHVAKMLTLTGASAKAVAADAQTVLRIETKLAEAALDNVALRDPSALDHRTKFPDLQALTPHFDWSAYFRSEGLPQSVAINVDQPKYMQEIERQLQQTPLADWKTYLRWSLVNSMAEALAGPIENEDFAFFGQYLSGAKEMKQRGVRCAEQIDRLLGEALGKKYVEKYFPPAAKARMQELVRNILLAMRDDILSRPWMSDETKERALAKVATFNPKIGYPDVWKDYGSVKVRRDALFENDLAGRRFTFADARATIGKPVDRGRWGMTPPTSDAYYNAQLNEIVFPAGILQPPAFDVDATDAVNYGAIGVVIGHEVSHGFDDQGAQFDFLGRFRNWWTADDLKRFTERGQCVVKQFEGYFIEPGIHHNGKLVLGESIGDLGGARIAYLAYQKSLQGKPRPADLDGFTPEQQFFIAWGQFRGDEIRPERQRLMVQTDPHPIAKYRVIGPLSNLPEFAQAFSCKAGDPMVRPAAERCEVW